MIFVVRLIFTLLQEQENLTKHESLVFVLSKQISLATTEASRLRSEHEAFAAAKAAEVLHTRILILTVG